MIKYILFFWGVNRMTKNEIDNNALNLLYKEMLVNNKMTNVANPKLKDNHIVGYSMLYAIKINQTAMVYDSTCAISKEGIEALFKSLDNNLKLIHTFKEINIKYLAHWFNGDEYIYDSNNDYLDVSINSKNDLIDIKNCLIEYISLKDSSKVFPSCKSKVLVKQ